MKTEEAIFAMITALPASERAASLDAACAGDPPMRARVEALLRSHDTTGFMEDGSNGVRSPDLASESSRYEPEKSGDRIGRYRLLQQIGEGGFGVVWMAAQVEPLTRRVALKIIKAGMDTREVIARFEAERQALALMDHPNIAKVHDAGATDKGRPFFVMELVKGIPITKFCDEQEFSTRQRLELFADVCSAINHAHQKGIIHRDLKPSNVMVTLNAERPVVKVIDFGIAKAIEGRLTDKTLFTRFEQFMGTPAYMSPEQAAISELDIDTRSDIYGLGILLYELLTGKPPFDSRTLISAGFEEMRRIIREVDAQKPSSSLNTLASDERIALAKARKLAPEKLNRLVDPDLDWIVMKAIEKDRSRRYETANALAMDIQRFLAGETVSATPPGAVYRFRKFARRNRMALRVAALLILATLVSTWQAIRASAGQREATKQTERAEAEEAVAKSANEEVQKKLREAAQSDRVVANDLAGQERYREAIIRLARACEYAPESSMAAEQATILCNAAVFHPAVAVFLGHSAGVNGTQFDRGGMRILTASADKTARVWEAATGRLIATCSGHTGDVRTAEFSPDGLRVVTASQDHTAILWEAATGRLLSTLSGHQDIVKTAAFSPDGSRVVTVSNDRTARVWDAAGGQQVLEISGHTAELNMGEFSPDSARLLTASDDKTARVWDSATGRLLVTLSGHLADVNAARFSPDAARIVTASNDNTARVWDAASGQLIVTLSGHKHRIRNAIFTPDGLRVVSISDDNTARVWDAADGRLIHALASHLERVWNAVCSPDGRCIVTLSDDASARIWDAGTGTLIATLAGHRAAVVGARFSPEGSRLVTSSHDGTARVWDLTSCRPVAVLSGHHHRVWNGQFSADGSRIVTNSDDGTAKVWNATTGSPIASLAGHRGSVWTAEFSPDGTRVLTASSDATAQLWDAVSGTPLATFSGHRGGVSSARFSRDGTRVVTASFDKTARVWDAASGQLSARLSGHDSFVWNASFSPDGARIVTGSDDGSAGTWDALTGRLDRRLSGFTGDVWGIDFDRTGVRVATASYDGSARVWEVATGRPLVTFSGHQKSIVRSVQFSPDGAFIVTASDDKSARIWNSVTGQPTAQPFFHEDSVRSAQFSPDGARVLSASWESARLWNVARGQLVAVLSGHRQSVQEKQRSLDAVRIESANAELAPEGKATEPEAFALQPLNMLSKHTARINGAAFNPDSSRVVTASDDGTARVWELLGTRQAPPPWYPNLLRILVSGTLNSDGVIEDLPAAALVRLRSQVLTHAAADQTRYGDLARYLLTPGPGKPVRPGATITCREAADSLITPAATLTQLEQAYALDPAHPLIQLALARFAPSEAQAEFLRSYGLGRMAPDVPTATLQQAAALLAVQPGQEAKQAMLLKRIGARP